MNQVTISKKEYDQLLMDSENLKRLLEEKYDIMEYFPLVGGYKKINYVSKAADGLKNLIKDLDDCFQFQQNLLKEKYPQHFKS